MKGIVLYCSQTGFTERYAQWIAKELGFDCAPAGKQKAAALSLYDAVVFGSWVRAGSLVNAAQFARLLPRLPGKKAAVFGVGARPADAVSLAVVEKAFPKERFPSLGRFYFPGGMCYEKMGGLSRKMLQTYAKMLKKQKEPTEETRKILEFLGTSFDCTNREALQPLFGFLKG